MHLHLLVCPPRPRQQSQPYSRADRSDLAQLHHRAAHEFEWRIGDAGGQPIASIGFELTAEEAASGVVYLDYLTWSGTPEVTLTRPTGGGTMWRRAWVNGVDRYDDRWPEPYRLIQNSGTGLLIQGTREWTDYEVSAPVRPHMVTSAGIGARVQGMRRYYALLLTEGDKIRLVKALDGEVVLAERSLPWQFDITYELCLKGQGNLLRASIDGEEIFDVEDDDRSITGGAVACLRGGAHGERSRKGATTRKVRRTFRTPTGLTGVAPSVPVWLDH